MSSFWDALFGAGNSYSYEEDVAQRERERFQNIEKGVLGPHRDNATLYATTVRLLKDANFSPYEEFARQVVVRFAERCDELGISPPHDAILLQMIGAAAGIYAAEQLPDLPPNPTPYGAGIAVGLMRDNLLRQQQKAVNPVATLDAITNALIASFLAITRHLPSMARDGGIVEGVPTLPLLDLLPNVGAVIEAALEPFAERNDIGLFRLVNNKVKSKLDRIAERSRSKRPIAPSDYDGAPREIVEAYLGDTPFERIFTESRIPSDISLEDRGEHTAIIAGSGWGKTQLLQSIIAGDPEQYEDPPALVVIDSTGAMVQRIHRLAIFNQDLKDRLLIIDPELDPVPALNPFDLSNSRFSAYDDGNDDSTVSVRRITVYVFAICSVIDRIAHLDSRNTR